MSQPITDEQAKADAKSLLDIARCLRAITVPEMSGITDKVWDNRSGPEGAVNTIRGLIHSLDLTKEGLGMKPTRICSNNECAKPVRSRGLCNTHYTQWFRSSRTESCSVDGCESSSYARGYCGTHYQRVLKYGSPDLPVQEPKGECSVDGCDHIEIIKGLCERHYKKLRKYGAPTLGRILRNVLPKGASTEERFWNKVDKSTECWMWLAGTNNYGYGNFVDAGNWFGAHRFAYELLVGPIPDGLVLDHLCHTNDPDCLDSRDCPHRRCCNPAHLEVVTTEENVRRGHRRTA